jgi:hypothetical protein
MAAQKSKIMLLSGSTSSDFNGKACSPLTVQWTVDTYNLAKGAAKAIIEAGGTKGRRIVGTRRLDGLEIVRDRRVDARMEASRHDMTRLSRQNRWSMQQLDSPRNRNVVSNGP